MVGFFEKKNAVIEKCNIQFLLAALVIFYRIDSTHVCQMHIKPSILLYLQYPDTF